MRAPGSTGRRAGLRRGLVCALLIAGKTGRLGPVRLRVRVLARPSRCKAMHGSSRPRSRVASSAGAARQAAAPPATAPPRRRACGPPRVRAAAPPRGPTSWPCSLLIALLALVLLYLFGLSILRITPWPHQAQDLRRRAARQRRVGRAPLLPARVAARAFVRRLSRDCFACCKTVWGRGTYVLA